MGWGGDFGACQELGSGPSPIARFGRGVAWKSGSGVGMLERLPALIGGGWEDDSMVTESTGGGGQCWEEGEKDGLRLHGPPPLLGNTSLPGR